MSSQKTIHVIQKKGLSVEKNQFFLFFAHACAKICRSSFFSTRKNHVYSKSHMSSYEAS